MILVDANILLYAEDGLSPFHSAAREWWDSVLSGTDPVKLCWPVLNAYIRIGTNPRVFTRPLTLDEAIARVQSWLEQPPVSLVHVTAKHWDIFRELLLSGQATANLVPDAHLAAIAIENGCTLCSTDADFSRFPRLKWTNPIGR